MKMKNEITEMPDKAIQRCRFVRHFSTGLKEIPMLYPDRKIPE